MFGSFANVIIYRIPRGESIVSPPSRCPSCGRRLGFFDLIPVFSQIFLRARCRYCKAKISWRYAAVEALCAALFAFITFYSNPLISAVPVCALAFVLVCVSMIDADSQIIPDGLLITGAIVGVLWVAASFFLGLDAPSPAEALLGAAAGAGPLFLIDRLCIIFLKKDGFGFGDVKLMLTAGLFTGPRLALASLFLAVMAGGLYGIFLLLTGKIKRGGYFAFGPFLAAGIMASLWFGERLIAFYFRA